MIFEDGLIFFFIAYADNHARSKWVIANSCFFRFLSNLLATIFMLLNLNEVMNIIFNIPAAVASTVGILIPLKGSNVHVDRLSTSTDCSLPGRSAAHQFYQPWPRNLVWWFPLRTVKILMCNTAIAAIRRPKGQELISAVDGILARAPSPHSRAVIRRLAYMSKWIVILRFAPTTLLTQNCRWKPSHTMDATMSKGRKRDKLLFRMKVTQISSLKEGYKTESTAAP